MVLLVGSPCNGGFISQMCEDLVLSSLDLTKWSWESIYYKPLVKYVLLKYDLKVLQTLLVVYPMVLHHSS